MNRGRENRVKAQPAYCAVKGSNSPVAAMLDTSVICFPVSLYSSQESTQPNMASPASTAFLSVGTLSSAHNSRMGTIPLCSLSIPAALYLDCLVIQCNSFPPSLSPFMVKLLFHCLTYLSALRSCQVIRLWKYFPVSLCQQEITRLEIC